MKRLLLILALLAGMAATTEASDLSKWFRGRNHYHQRDHYRSRPPVRQYRPRPRPMTRWEVREMMERDAARRRRYDRRYYHRAPFTFHFDF